MNSIGDMEFCEDFIKGYQDCRDGVRHQSKSKDYDDGYAARYEHEQVMSVIARSENEHH